MTRLPVQPDERIDRSKRFVFSFEGQAVPAFEGDTIGSALFAGGRRVFSRSFKYHRRRGLLCCSGHCANCMMTVDGVPNVRVCTQPARAGLHVEAQNTLFSLDWDWMAVTDKLGGPFTPPGFYYKTFIRPRSFWPLYEKFLRHAAGLGKLREDATRDGRVDVEHRHADVLVIGAGESGLEAAIAAAREGKHVSVVDEGAEAGGGLLLERGGVARARALAAQTRAAGVEIIAPARAIGVYQGNLVPVEHGNLLLRFRAGEIVVAAGIMEQPLVFPGNDLVGVMLPGGVRRLVNVWSLKPGERAVVLTVDDRGLAAADDLRAAGVDVAEVVDFRERKPASVTAKGRRGQVRSLTVDGKTVECDLVVMSGSPQPAYPLLAHAGARVDFDPSRGIFFPTSLPDGIRAVGAAAGDVGAPAVPPPVLGAGGDKCFVCICEDQTDEGLEVRDRGGVRLDRAGEALHDGDDGAVSGEALPAERDPRLRERESGRRADDRADDRPSPVDARLDGPACGASARAGKAHVDAPPPQGHGRADLLDRGLAASSLVHGRLPGGGAAGPRVGRDHRRLDPRQDPRQGAGRGRVPRPPLSEPLHGPEGRPHPLRRPHERRGPDLRRRHRSPASPTTSCT